MDDYSPEPHPLAIWSVRIMRFVACIILLAIIVAVVYVTCLPSLSIQQRSSAASTNHRPDRR